MHLENQIHPVPVVARRVVRPLRKHLDDVYGCLPQLMDRLRERAQQLGAISARRRRLHLNGRFHRGDGGLAPQHGAQQANGPIADGQRLQGQCADWRL